jgi:hypothetical protein
MSGSHSAGGTPPPEGDQPSPYPPPYPPPHYAAQGYGTTQYPSQAPPPQYPPPYPGDQGIGQGHAAQGTPGQGKRRMGLRIAGGIAALAVVFLAGVAVGSSGKTTVAAGGASATPATPAGGSATASHAASPPPAASAPANPSGSQPIGTTYTATVGHKQYTVTADKVLSPARPDDSFDAASHRHYLVGVKFTLAGVKGHSSDDANNDAVIQGSDGQLYDASFTGLAVGTNFSDGSWNVSPGTSEIGWVTFELPKGVTPASVQWSPTGGFGSATATWTVSP